MGPCPDFLSAIPAFIMLGTAIISLFLILKAIILIIKTDRRYFLPLIVHLAFWICIVLIYTFDKNR
jgi:hypothetical protein